MTSNDELAALLYQLQDEVARLKAASQLSSSTVGTDAETAVAVDDVVTDAAMTTDALPGMQDDTADSNQGVVDLQAYLSTVSDDLDARFELKDQELADATEDLAASQQQLEDTFGTQLEGLSDDVDTAITAAGAAGQVAADAKQAALDAAGVAGGKGELIVQKTAPTGSRATVANLWVDISLDANGNPKNTPNRYNPDTAKWEPITDQKVLDAVAAATAAQATADGKPLILFSTTSGPSGTAPTGSIWFLWDANKYVAGQWLQSGTLAAPVWTPQQIRSEVIANLDVAKLTVGSAAIADLVAQKIAASTANFQTANVSNLFVTQGATLSQAVIDFLFANVVQAKKITAGMIDVDSLNGITITGVKLNAGSLTSVDDLGRGIYLGGGALSFYSTSGGDQAALRFQSGLFTMGIGSSGSLFLGGGTARFFNCGFVVGSGTGVFTVATDGTVKASGPVTAADFRTGDGNSVLPSKNYVELTATAKISDSTAAFVTGWAVDNTLTTNAGMVSISGNAVTLAAAGVYTVDTVSQSPATSATLANRNYLQLQTGSTMDDGRVNRVITRSENIIQGSATFAVVAGQAIRVVAYQTTSADRNMTFTLRITRHG